MNEFVEIEQGTIRLTNGALLIVRPNQDNSLRYGIYEYRTETRGWVKVAGNDNVPGVHNAIVGAMAYYNEGTTP